MSGDKNKPGTHPEEQQDAQAQIGALDAVMTMTKLVPFGPSRGIHFGSTNFENYGLNQIIDIVESANPELLETAGTALVDARDAIKKAADELKGNLGDIDWKGEARKAFTDWGDSLIKTAEGVADYADTIGTQVLAAGSGLAMVKKSMPHRDNRADPKPPKEFDKADKVETNDEYMAAVKAEKDRQEAINQMYRLASFYTVSAGMMGTAEEPVFPKMPDVGVPVPAGRRDRGPVPRTEASPLRSVEESATVSGQPAREPVTRAQSVGDLPSAKQPADLLAPPDPRVGTQIDSVGTLPQQDVAKPINVTPPATTGPTVPTTGPVPPMVPGTAPPSLRGRAGRITGPGGGLANKIPPSPQGRVGGLPGTGPAPRTSTGPLGQAPRSTTPGPAASRGTGPLGQVPRTAPPGQAAARGTGPMGRGVVGGMPKPTGPVPGQAGGTRGPVGPMQAAPASRSGSGTGRAANGVVGGRPATGAVPTGKGSKLPRGTVIGGEGASAPRPAGQKPVQRGVIGAPPVSEAGRGAARRLTAGPNGVIGAPNAGNSGAAPGRAAVPRGGASSQGPDKRQPLRDEQRGNPATTD
ncbi:hypothetical protein AB0O68_17665 [Streptomyces sp. NPDC087512]|uniref:WXG100 family type VII secretion target n=1 Tax=Streptomyces sp. NPDC087512 TaxID=3155059 RepID=UPI003426697D